MVVLVGDGRAAALCGRRGRSRASRPGALAAPGRPRTGSGCRPGLRAASSLQGQEPVRDRDEGDVVGSSRGRVAVKERGTNRQVEVYWPRGASGRSRAFAIEVRRVAGAEGEASGHVEPDFAVGSDVRPEQLG